MNAIDDKLYARTERFINNMNNILLRIKGEATKIAKKQNRSNITEGQLIGVLIGGIALGAAASLLLAPKSGKETRTQLANNFKDVSNKVTNWEKKQTERLKDLAKDSEKQVKQGSSTNV
jgi:hypothetical protein